VRGTTSHPAGERARTIKANIESAAADPAVPLDSVRLAGDDKAVDIMAGERSLMTVYDADARREDLSADELATGHRLRIMQAIAEYRRARSPEALRRGVLWAGIATLILAIGILALWRSARRIDRWASERMASRIGSVGIESFEFVQAGKIHRAILGAVHLARTLVLAAGLIAYLSFTLAQFPWTRGLSRHIVSVVTAPLPTMGQAILAEIPNLVFLAILVYVFRIVLRLLRLFFDAVANGSVKLAGFEQDWAVPTYKIVRFAAVAFGVIVAYPYIPGSHTEAF